MSNDSQFINHEHIISTDHSLNWQVYFPNNIKHSHVSIVKTGFIMVLPWKLTWQCTHNHLEDVIFAMKKVVIFQPVMLLWAWGCQIKSGDKFVVVKMDHASKLHEQKNQKKHWKKFRSVPKGQGIGWQPWKALGGRFSGPKGVSQHVRQQRVLWSRGCRQCRPFKTHKC